MEYVEGNWLILSIVCGFVAKSIGRSFWKYFFLSLLLSPVIGFVVLLIKGKKTEETVVNYYEVREEPNKQSYIHSPAGNMRYCSACGARVEPNAHFCSNCGTNLETTTYKQ